MLSWTQSDFLVKHSMASCPNSPTGRNIGLHWLRHCSQLPTSPKSASCPIQYRQLLLPSPRFGSSERMAHHGRLIPVTEIWGLLTICHGKSGHQFGQHCPVAVTGCWNEIGVIEVELHAICVGGSCQNYGDPEGEDRVGCNWITEDVPFCIWWGFRKKRCLERSKATLCQLGCWILKPLYPLSCRSASPSIWKVSVNLAGNGPDWSKVPMMSTFLWLQRVSFSWPVYVQLGGRMLKGKPTNSLRELPLPVSRVGSGNPLGSLSFLACILAILLAPSPSLSSLLCSFLSSLGLLLALLLAYPACHPHNIFLHFAKKPWLAG